MKIVQINIVLCVQQWEREVTFLFTPIAGTAFRMGILSQFVPGEAVTPSQSAANLS